MVAASSDGEEELSEQALFPGLLADKGQLKASKHESLEFSQHLSDDPKPDTLSSRNESSPGLKKAQARPAGKGGPRDWNCFQWQTKLLLR